MTEYRERSIKFSKGCSLCYYFAIYRQVLLFVCSMNHIPPYLFLRYQLNWVWMVFFSKCWDRVLLRSLRAYILKQLLFSISVSGRIFTSISKSNCSIVNLYLLKEQHIRAENGEKMPERENYYLLKLLLNSAKCADFKSYLAFVDRGKTFRKIFHRGYWFYMPFGISWMAQALVTEGCQ